MHDHRKNIRAILERFERDCEQERVRLARAQLSRSIGFLEHLRARDAITRVSCVDHRSVVMHNPLSQEFCERHSFDFNILTIVTLFESDEQLKQFQLIFAHMKNLEVHVRISDDIHISDFRLSARHYCVADKRISRRSSNESQEKKCVFQKKN